MILKLFNPDWQNKKHVIDQLIVSSKANWDYYFLLSIATVVTTIGILYKDQVIFLGGILIAPLLSPILALSLGIVTGNPHSIFRALKNIIISLFVITLLSYLVTFLLSPPTDYLLQIIQQLRVGTHYLYVAILSGAAASFSWVKQKVSMILPGVAMAVSLLPPVSFWGIAWYAQSYSLFYQAFLLFTLNLLGITLASAIIFLLTGFSSLNKEEADIIKKKG